jgi:hypothetical protein
MAGNLSNYAEQQIRKHMFLTGSWTKPSHLYIGLSTTTIADSATGSSGITEPSGNGYSRQQLDPSDSSWNAASSTNGTASNASAITFTASGGNWGSITDVFIADASTGGNIYWYGPLASAKTINDGDSLTFAIDALSCALD